MSESVSKDSPEGQSPSALNDTPEQPDGAATEVTPDDVAGTLTPQPTVSDEEIASLWLAFLGLPDTPYTRVPAIRYCERRSDWLGYNNGQWTRNSTDNTMVPPTQVPLLPEGQAWPRSDKPHLLPSSARELTSLSQQIRRTRGLTRLLHTVWRQDVKFGQDKAASFRLVAGENYASRFRPDGTQRPAKLPLPSVTDATETTTDDSDSRILSDTNDMQGGATDPMMARINARLNDPQPIPFSTMLAASPDNGRTEESQPEDDMPTPIWQIDGEITVFLKYINRVPYLHIDSDLAYRQPIPVESPDNTNQVSGDAVTPVYELVSVPFSQLRRVISTQVHYFDHPLFGMIVEIRRYERPAPENTDEETEQ